MQFIDTGFPLDYRKQQWAYAPPGVPRPMGPEEVAVEGGNFTSVSEGVWPECEKEIRGARVAAVHCRRAHSETYHA